jgi:cell division protein FtsL
MASIAVSLPRPRAKRPRYQRAAGRAHFAEIYYVKHIDNSRLRRQIDPEKCRDCLSLLGLGVLVFLFGLLFAVQHFRGLRYGYQVEQLKAQRSSMQDWNHQLRLEHASLTDPQRIDKLARKKLGLVWPLPEQVIFWSGEIGGAARARKPVLARNFSAVSGEASRGE